MSLSPPAPVRVPDREWHNFYIRANKAGYQTNEPVHIKDPESPTLLRQLVYRAVNEEGLSMARGAELLGTSIAEMEQFCGLAVT